MTALLWWSAPALALCGVALSYRRRWIAAGAKAQHWFTTSVNQAETITRLTRASYDANARALYAEIALKDAKSDAAYYQQATWNLIRGANDGPVWKRIEASSDTDVIAALLPKVGGR